jgi:GNAT superfamily N-acetyltransferase
VPAAGPATFHKFYCIKINSLITSHGRTLYIALLADHAEQIDDLAARYRAEWAPYYGDAGPGDACEDLSSRCNRDRLPAGLVAIDGGQAVGTAALDRDESTGLAPAIVGLLVVPGSRGQGIASALINAAERLAGELGYDEVFISTSILQGSLRRRGWQESGDVTFANNERGKVFVRNLTATEST